MHALVVGFEECGFTSFVDVALASIGLLLAIVALGAAMVARGRLSRRALSIVLGSLGGLILVAGLALGAIAGTGLLWIAAAIWVRPRAAAPLAWAALVVGGLVVGGGWIGQTFALGRVRNAVERTEPEQRAALEAAGEKEAHACLDIGLGGGVPVVVLGFVALLSAGGEARKTES